MKHFNVKRFLKNHLIILSTVLFIVLTCSISFASSGGGGDKPIDFGTFWMKVFNLTFLLTIIFFLVKKPFKNFLNSRQDTIKGEIDSADEALSSANKELSDSEKKLKELAKEVDAISEKMKHEGELEKERILKHTKELTEKIKAQTEQTVKREFEIVQKKIQEETIEHTIDSAEELLMDKFKPADQDQAAKKIASEISTVKDIDVFLQNPISAGLKKKVPLDIDSAKKVSEMTMSFIKVLLAADDDSKKNINDIKTAYDNFINDVTGISKAQIYSATDIGDAALKSITTSLKSAVGKDIEVEVIKDPSIIGGIVTKIGSLVFDASVKTQLETMRENLKSEVG